jgi:flagellar protein FliO/FliZ
MNITSVFFTLSVLAAVIGLVVLAGRLATHFSFRSHPAAGRLLILRESVALDTKRRVHLLQCGDRQVVLLTGGSQDLLVGWVNEA